MKKTMTKARALQIQAKQAKFYAERYGDKVYDLIAAITTAHELKDGLEYDIVTINVHIPHAVVHSNASSPKSVIAKIRLRRVARNVVGWKLCQNAHGKGFDNGDYLY